MKTHPFACHRLLVAIAFICSFAVGHAQQNADDNLLFNNGNGGDGTWENGAGGTPWLDNGQSVNWDNSILTFATFQGTPGTGTVSGTVDALALTFNTNYTVTGGTIQNVGDNTPITINNNSTVSIASDFDFDTGYSNDRFNVFVNGTSSLTMGNILYTNPSGSTDSTGHRIVIFNTNGASNINLTGTYSTGTTGVTGGLWLIGSNAATMTLSGDYSTSVGGTLATAFNGTILLNSTKLGTDQITMGNAPGDTGAVLTDGAYTVSNTISMESINFGAQTFGTSIVGGNTADVSTYTGEINMIQTQADLTAVAGGRVIFNGDVGNTSNAGIIKTGQGTVVLGTSNDYGLGNYFGGPVGTVAAEIEQGTLLINNGIDKPANNSISAFGNNTGKVLIDGGATLGGNGTATQTIVAAAGSTIAPGDAGQAIGSDPNHPTSHIAASIGQLSLGGITATGTAQNPFTFTFKLTGNESGNNAPVGGVDFDTIVVGAMSLNGTVDINIEALGSAPLLTGTLYTLITGTPFTWTGNPDFEFTLPQGYALDPNYLSGGTPGYDYDPTTGNFAIELIAVPEPTTYALFALGLAGLVVVYRFRRLRA